MRLPKWILGRPRVWSFLTDLGFVVTIRGIGKHRVYRIGWQRVSLWDPNLPGVSVPSSWDAIERICEHPPIAPVGCRAVIRTGN